MSDTLVFTATFEPKRADDLHEGARQWIGHECEWMFGWIIEAGPYEGEWACVVCEFGPPLGWVPLRDLNLGEP